MLALLSILGILSGFLVVDALSDSDSSDDSSDGDASPTDEGGEGSGLFDTTYVGTDENDTFYGTVGADKALGLEGDDRLLGGNGNDALYGNEGVDVIEGGNGNDELVGGPGNDLLMGQPGADVLSGWKGNDFITGGEGADELYGNEGDDFLMGGNGADILKGGDGNDEIWGAELLNRDLTYDDLVVLSSKGADVEYSDLDNLYFTATDSDTGDIIDGGNGNDSIVLGNGDVATGGEGNDDFNVVSWINDGEEATITDFTAGEDVISVGFPMGDPSPTISLSADVNDAMLYADGQLIAVIKNGAGTVELGNIQLIPMS
jgi:serralysin